MSTGESSAPPPSPSDDAPAARQNGYAARRAGHWVERGGAVVAGAGALALLVGGFLPWARFSVFGVAVSVPGVATWGAAGVVLGLAALSLRRHAAVAIVLGVAAFVLGGQAGRTAGREVVRRMLSVQMTLAPVNDRLARVTLPPIEPFDSIGPAASYVGPGPLWTLGGGAALALGGALRLAGRRQARGCLRCGLVWPEGREVYFCPRCGTSAAGGDAGCAVCRRPLRPGDRFCVHCGVPATGARSTPAPAPPAGQR